MTSVYRFEVHDMRHSDYPVAAEFVDRWSPRGYDAATTLSETELLTLFEAARWAPSSSNEQPWKFYYPATKAARADFNNFVNEINRTWAAQASHILVVCARKAFAVSGKPNPHAWYDTGAAVMALVLQAEKLGYRARQMGGILPEVIAARLGIDRASEDIICAVAIGKQGDFSHLLEKHRAMENPNGRKPVSEFAVAV